MTSTDANSQDIVRIISRHAFRGDEQGVWCHGCEWRMAGGTRSHHVEHLVDITRKTYKFVRVSLHALCESDHQKIHFDWGTVAREGSTITLEVTNLSLSEEEKEEALAILLAHLQLQRREKSPITTI